MRAILPGRPQSQRQAVCTAHWDGLRLVAYISGNTVVILRNPKDIVQTISIDHVEKLSTVAIDESSGRIAISDDERILVFDAVGRDEGDLRWTQIHDITIPDNGRIRTLSWGTPEELLVGGTELWLYNISCLGDAQLIWRQAIANEVVMAQFSNDAELIASCGAHDRLVKIWRRLSFELDSTRFDVSYLPHPAAVTDLHWRKPWHKEQSLDTLLYTFCADNQVRVWAYSDPHSLSVAQLIATIDTNTSIEPRRRSIGSISRRRYVFVVDSRDFSFTTEKAIQKSHNRSVDHALEHLIEIANRSPEICIVFDGLGHMSVWGLENAGCKTKKPTEVFNIMLVDQVDIQLNFDASKDEDYVQFCAFGGGLDEASLCLLVHSYTGQIDWYESPIAHFFDTTSRKDRVKLLSSWSGHDLAIDHVARGVAGEKLLSWTEKGQAIVWFQSPTGALRRQCEVNTEKEIIKVVLLDLDDMMLILHHDAISLWDISRAHGVRITLQSLGTAEEPIALQLVNIVSKYVNHFHFVCIFRDETQQVWRVQRRGSANGTSPSILNGDSSPLVRISNIEKCHFLKGRIIPYDFVSNVSRSRGWETSPPMASVDQEGSILYSLATFRQSSDTMLQDMTLCIQTNIKSPALARASLSGKCALVSQDRKSLTIWDLNQGICEWHYEHENVDEIQKLAWASTSQGNLFLFVGFSYSAIFVGQFRYPALSVRQSAWYITQKISLRDFTTIHIGDVCWLPSGDIAITAGHQIFVLSNVVTETDSPIIRRSQKLVDNESASAVVDMASATLPIFRADFLGALVLEGGLDAVENILRKLYEKLKYFSEGDELASDLDLSSTEVFHSTHNVVTNGVGLINGDTNGSVVELDEVETRFKEYISNADIWQLGPKRRNDMSSFLTTIVKVCKYRRSLDDNGLRYLYSLYTTPDDRDLPWSAFVFASKSTSQEALTDLILGQHDGKLTWSVARRTGLFVWLNDTVALQAQFENVARTEYNKSDDRNPVDCSLHYLALNKKSVLQGLWRMTYGSKEKENTMKLLANNFEDPNWKATALKNAYALLSRRRFEYAAAFFLLGSSLKDAVNVCINQLKDIQLAIAITRVWDKDTQQSGEVLRDLLQRYLLSIAVDSEQGRWMASWAYTTLDQPTNAIKCLVQPLHQVIPSNLADYDRPIRSLSFRANDPHTNILYTQLRHSLVKQNKWTAEVLSQREEWNFVLRCAHWWVRAGMDHLALRILREWEFIPHQGPRHANAPTTLVVPVVDSTASLAGDDEMNVEEVQETRKKPPPTQFLEPTADSLLDSFGF